jgi:L-rhamnose mutarotase
MGRQVFFLDLKSDSLGADYDACHRPGCVPPQVLDDIRSSGVVAMEIYRCGNRLVLISETQEGLDAADRIGSRESEDWEVLMGEFQQAVPAAAKGEKWAEGAKVFDLGQH